MSRNNRSKHLNENKSQSKLESVARWGHNVEELDELDDWTSEWNHVKSTGGVWGGRRRGGRGIRLNSGVIPDIVVDNVTLQFSNKTLLTGANLRFLKGHKYGFIGANGVGKSTLLRRMARASIPGLALHFEMVYLQQELPSPVDQNLTVLKYILQSTFVEETVETLQSRLSDLRVEEGLMEEKLTNKDNVKNLETDTEYLCLVAEEIERIEEKIQNFHSSKDRLMTSLEIHNALPDDIKQIFKGLQISNGAKFGKAVHLDTPMVSLSGGWRMRVALAIVLILAKSSEVLLLDECTNHLDLSTIVWLEQYLLDSTDDNIVIIVSHDRSFMDAVCTDIVQMANEQLNYFPGNYSEFERLQNDLQSYQQNLLDAQKRKENHIKKAIQTSIQKNSKNNYDNLTVSNQKKKLERASMHRQMDGKKFKLFSLSDFSEKGMHMPQYITAIRKNRALNFKFPVPDASVLHLSSPDSNIISYDNISNSYVSERDVSSPMGQLVLSDVTFNVSLNSRIAIVGPNGNGKSTLLYSMLSDEIIDAMDLIMRSRLNEEIREVSEQQIEVSLAEKETPQTKEKIDKATGKLRRYTDSRCNDIKYKHNLRLKGSFWSHRNLRIAIINQHHIDNMSQYLTCTPVQFIAKIASVYKEMDQRTASQLLPTEFSNLSELDIRAHLGNFGISGNIALQPIGSLSGGQKARLAFAGVFITKPHVLLLDEPSNNLSVDATNSLILACKDFPGAIILVSHNCYVLSEVCKELIVVENHTARVVRSVDEVSLKLSSANATPQYGTQKINAENKPAASNVDSNIEKVLGEETFVEILSAYVQNQNERNLM